MDFRAAQKALAPLQAALSALQQLDTVIETARLADQEIGKLTTRRDALAAQVVDLSGQTKVLQQTIVELRQTMATAQADAGAARQEAKQAMAQAQATQSALHDEIAHARRVAHASLAAELEQAKTEQVASLSRLREQREAAEHELAAVRQTAADLHASLGVLAAR